MKYHSQINNSLHNGYRPPLIEVFSTDLETALAASNTEPIGEDDDEYEWN